MSVYNQTFFNWEAIIVVDGSTDASSAILSRPPFSSDARFRIVRTPNRGVSAARSLGLSLATGSFVALLDHDDIWHPKKLSQQLEVLSKNPELLGVFSWYLISKKKSGRLVHSRLVAYRNVKQMIRGWISLRGNGPLMTSTLLFRKSMVTHLFDLKRNAIGDLDFVLKIPVLGALSFVPFPLVIYVQHNNQMHNRATSMLETKQYLTDAKLELFSNYGLRQGSVISTAQAFASLLRIFEVRSTWIGRIVLFIRDHEFLHFKNYQVIFYVIIKRFVGRYLLLRQVKLVREYWS